MEEVKKRRRSTINFIINILKKESEIEEISTLGKTGKLNSKRELKIKIYWRDF